jgi:uncharacterized membrane protein YGL010W
LLWQSLGIIYTVADPTCGLLTYFGGMAMNYTAIYLYQSFGLYLFKPFLYIHILSWFTQVLGHKVYESKYNFKI